MSPRTGTTGQTQPRAWLLAGREAPRAHPKWQRGSATPCCWPWLLPRSGMTSLQGRAKGMMECW